MDLISFLTLLSSSTGLAIIAILLAICYKYLSAPKGIPPGPIGLPFVGYFPFLGRHPHETMVKLGKKYGPIFSMYLGSTLTIVLNDFETINEALVKNANLFSGKPLNVDFVDGQRDELSVKNTDGPFWRDIRRFSLSLLRDLGVGKAALEPRILDEIRHFLGVLRNSKGKPINLRGSISSSIANNICILVLGKRFDYDDPWLRNLLKYLEKLIASGSSVSAYSFFPWIKKIPFVNDSNLLMLQKNLDKSIQRLADEYRKMHTDDDKLNYLDAFLSEQSFRQKKSTEDMTFSDISLVQNARFLYSAGTETTSNTLLWLILHMMQYPEVQRKAQMEIDEVIGRDRAPCCADRTRTPYVEAVIYEVQRKKTLVPLNLPHRNMDACKILGYNIPKNCYIVTNLWNVHMDPKHWKDPENFRPERFLSSDGQAIKYEHLIPFSMGKRECLGKSLAKMELYLYFTSMLQNFTFKLPPGAPPEKEPKVGLTYGPGEYETCAIPRNPT